jgi:hypothetical protein
VIGASWRARVLERLDGSGKSPAWVLEGVSTLTAFGICGRSAAAGEPEITIIEPS